MNLNITMLTELIPNETYSIGAEETNLLEVSSISTSKYWENEKMYCLAINKDNFSELSSSQTFSCSPIDHQMLPKLIPHQIQVLTDICQVKMWLNPLWTVFCQQKMLRWSKCYSKNHGKFSRFVLPTSGMQLWTII